MAPELLHIAPNPAADRVKLICSTVGDAPGHLSVFNVSGQLIFEENTTKSSWQLQTETFISGVYLVYWQIGARLFGGRMEVVRK